MSERAVYCAGGPLDGYGFTERAWSDRRTAERNLGRGPSLGYIDGPEVDLSGRPKAAEALKDTAVRWLRWVGDDGPASDGVPAVSVGEILGQACPVCGWYGGKHRPAGAWLDPCPAVLFLDGSNVHGPIDPDRKCEASGETILRCKRTDLCDCFEHPEYDRELTARRAAP